MFDKGVFLADYEMTIYKENGTCNVTRIPTDKSATTWDVTTDSDGKPKLLHSKDQAWAKDLQYQGNVSNCIN